jgi:hypothetical protein
MGLRAPDYKAGWNDPLRGALALFQLAGWVYRRCNEIIAEPELDVLKAYSLAHNCVRFRDEAAKWIASGDITEVLQELVRLTLASGAGNAAKTPEEINADYKQLYVAAGNFVTWATNALPQAGANIPNVTVTVARAWPEPDFNLKVAKSQAVVNQVTTLRAVFD